MKSLLVNKLNFFKKKTSTVVNLNGNSDTANNNQNIKSAVKDLRSAKLYDLNKLKDSRKCNQKIND